MEDRQVYESDINEISKNRKGKSSDKYKHNIKKWVFLSQNMYAIVEYNAKLIKSTNIIIEKGVSVFNEKLK